MLLKNGAKLPISYWNKLLIYATENDDPYYVELAIKTGNFHSSPFVEGAFSVNMCIEKSARKVLEVIKNSFDPSDFETMLSEKDIRKEKKEMVLPAKSEVMINQMQREDFRDEPKDKYIKRILKKEEDNNDWVDDEPVSVYYINSNKTFK
eukprot:TRINITY_DN3471_c0_g3_i1.p2 TRINITY_DN3471_c0_g3~~TRINITY_DN3471_c0_g3_i1.p2  ORF type:complete len:150 (-),score=41.96 TRINITY_DN3471_c0_g3_i1:130-579(-)